MWYKQSNVQSTGVSVLPLNIPMSKTLVEILASLASKGKLALIVGGSVRDAMTGYQPKDIDIEVYNSTFDELAEVLQKYGRTDLVGKSFGVIKFTDPEGNEYDFSVPRRDNKTGVGHKDFSVTFDSTITPKEAAARRDFTINALAYDPLTQEVHDYYGGVEDLQNKILRATSPAFAEDPLRVLRGMQFAARFGMTLDPETAEMCKQMAEHYHTLPKERLKEEWMKLAIKGKYPGSVFDFLVQSGWIKFYPRLEQLLGVPQDSEWHPEGTVETHTAHVMNAAAEIADREGLSGKDRAVLIFSALTHDLAKSLPEHGGTTLQREKDGKMRWTSHGHERAGGPMAKELLESMGVDKDLIQKVVPLVENHLQHIHYKPGTSSSGPARQLADKIKPATLNELLYLIEADHSGRPPLPKGLPPEALALKEMAQKEQILHSPPQRIINGKDVLPFYGNVPGRHIGEAVTEAYKAQLHGKINNLEEGLLWLKQYLRNKTALIKGQHVLPYFDNKPGPHIGEVTNKAWDAQVAGDFTDDTSAQAWLANYLNNKSQDQS